ncbi:serine hydrolase [Streptomyces sp. KMM 9044]|uniref:serine hydrolase n=1 Tax=Streptomyces sp. KMM 9044 TaxID=2744474 RepID=UPI003FA70239
MGRTDHFRAGSITKTFIATLVLQLADEHRLPLSDTVWGHNGHMSGSYVRSAAAVDGRHVLTFRVHTDAIADPGLEPAVLAAEFCPRTR